MIRLFAGIDFPEHIQEQLYSLRGGVPGASWKPKENLHITLRFIGNVDEADADYIHEGFMQIRAPAFNLQMTQVGFSRRTRLHSSGTSLDWCKLLSTIRFLTR